MCVCVCLNIQEFYGIYFTRFQTSSGAYVDNDVGGAAATGDGDIMMRFLPRYRWIKKRKLLFISVLCLIPKFKVHVTCHTIIKLLLFVRRQSNNMDLGVPCLRLINKDVTGSAKFINHGLPMHPAALMFLALFYY